MQTASAAALAAAATSLRSSAISCNVLHVLALANRQACRKANMSDFGLGPDMTIVPEGVPPPPPLPLSLSLSLSLALSL